MPRLFTALSLPHSAVTYLSLLRGGLPGARFIDSENYHLTLRFIGDVENHMADEIVSALDCIRSEPFEIKIQGLDVFGGKKPHSLFAKVAPCQALSKLQADIARACQRLRLPPDGRKFTPHVTIARLKDVPPQSAARFLAQHGGISLAPFIVRDFVLLSSRDSVGGGPYVREETYPFQHDQQINEPQIGAPL